MARYVNLDDPKIIHTGRDKFGNSIYHIPPDTVPFVPVDLRDLVADEVEYRGLPEAVINMALREIFDSNRLMEVLDSVVNEAISRCEMKL